MNADNKSFPQYIVKITCAPGRCVQAAHSSCVIIHLKSKSMDGPSNNSSGETSLDGSTALCATDFWDSVYTWYPDDGRPPDFTPCFHHTVLVWAPCAQLWLTSVVEVRRAGASRAGPIPWAPANTLKALLTVLAIATSTGQLVVAAKVSFFACVLTITKNL